MTHLVLEALWDFDPVFLNTTWLRSDRTQELLSVSQNIAYELIETMLSSYPRAQLASACAVVLAQADDFWDQECTRVVSQYTFLPNSFAGSYLLYVHSTHADSINRAHGLVEVEVPSLTDYLRQLYRSVLLHRNVNDRSALKHSVRDAFHFILHHTRLILSNMTSRKDAVRHRPRIADEQLSVESGASYTREDTLPAAVHEESALSPPRHTPVESSDLPPDEQSLVSDHQLTAMVRAATASAAQNQPHSGHSKHSASEYSASEHSASEHSTIKPLHNTLDAAAAPSDFITPNDSVSQIDVNGGLRLTKDALGRQDNPEAAIPAASRVLTWDKNATSGHVPDLL